MKVHITSDASQKLWTYVRAVNTEIGGFGYAWLEDNGDLVWKDTFLVPQYASYSEVDFESVGGDAAAVERAANDGVLGSEGFVWVSWHSHHTLQAFWSGTDDKRIKALAATGIPHLLSFVGCHDNAHRVRYDAFNVQHGGITIPQVTMDDLDLCDDLADPLFEQLFEDVAKNVLEKPRPQGVRSAPPANVAKSANPDRLTVDEAFEVKELMKECNLSYRDAVEVVKTSEFWIGPADVVGGFDQQACELAS